MLMLLSQPNPNRSILSTSFLLVVHFRFFFALFCFRFPLYLPPLPPSLSPSLSSPSLKTIKLTGVIGKTVVHLTIRTFAIVIQVSSSNFSNRLINSNIRTFFYGERVEWLRELRRIVVRVDDVDYNCCGAIWIDKYKG